MSHPMSRSRSNRRKTLSATEVQSLLSEANKAEDTSPLESVGGNIMSLAPSPLPPLGGGSPGFQSDRLPLGAVQDNVEKSGMKRAAEKSSKKKQRRRRSIVIPPRVEMPDDAGAEQPLQAADASPLRKAAEDIAPESEPARRREASIREAIDDMSPKELITKYHGLAEEKTVDRRILAAVLYRKTGYAMAASAELDAEAIGMHELRLSKRAPKYTKARLFSKLQQVAKDMSAAKKAEDARTEEVTQVRYTRDEEGDYNYWECETGAPVSPGSFRSRYYMFIGRDAAKEQYAYARRPQGHPAADASSDVSAEDMMISDSSALSEDMGLALALPSPAMREEAPEALEAMEAPEAPEAMEEPEAAAAARGQADAVEVVERGTATAAKAGLRAALKLLQAPLAAEPRRAVADAFLTCEEELDAAERELRVVTERAKQAFERRQLFAEMRLAVQLSDVSAEELS